MGDEAFDLLAGDDGESGVAANPGDQPGLPKNNFNYYATKWNWQSDNSDYLGTEIMTEVPIPLPILILTSANSLRVMSGRVM